MNVSLMFIFSGIFLIRNWTIKQVAPNFQYKLAKPLDLLTIKRSVKNFGNEFFSITLCYANP